MKFFSEFVLKVKKAETPLYRGLKSFARTVIALDIPLPPPSRHLYFALWSLGAGTRSSLRWLWVLLYRKPVTRSLCASSGPRLALEQIPSISGNVRVHLGHDVRISGTLVIGGGRVFDEPELRIGNRVFIGHGVTFSVSQRIVVEDDVLIAQGCFVADNSGHPLDPTRRATGEPPSPDDVRPVRICQRAWLGRMAMVLPGVTIGEGAVVGAGAVVTHDVPASAVCVGSPGRIVGRPVAEANVASGEPP